METSFVFRQAELSYFLFICMHSSNASDIFELLGIVAKTLFFRSAKPITHAVKLNQTPSFQTKSAGAKRVLVNKMSSFLSLVISLALK